jgi:hypothetical protein
MSDIINVDTLVHNQSDKHGMYKHNIAVIVVIDKFTRWIELYTIPDYTEQVAALKLLGKFKWYITLG